VIVMWRLHCPIKNNLKETFIIIVSLNDIFIFKKEDPL